MSHVPFSPRRAGLIARATFIEASRQRLLQLLLLGAAALVLGVKVFQEFNFGLSELKFIADFGHGSVIFFGSILTIALAWLVQLHPRLPHDDEAAAAGLVLARIRELEAELGVPLEQRYLPGI